MNRNNQVPRLLDLSLNRFSVLLWNTKRNRSALVTARRCNPRLNQPYDFILKDQVTGLAIPDEMKQKLQLTARRIGVEIVNWMTYHDGHLNKVMSYFYHEIIWTIHGRADWVKTARRLAWRFTFRYPLVALYSQEDLIESMWNQMPASFRTGRLQTVATLKCNQLQLVSFWTLYKFGDITQMQCAGHGWEGYGPDARPFVCAFKCSYRSNNHTSMVYFYRKLTLFNKSVALFNLLRSGHDWVGKLLLQEADAEERSFLFNSAKAYPLCVRWVLAGNWKMLGTFVNGLIVRPDDLEKFVQFLGRDSFHEDDPPYDAQNVEKWLNVVKPNLILRATSNIAKFNSV